MSSTGVQAESAAKSQRSKQLEAGQADAAPPMPEARRIASVVFLNPAMAEMRSGVSITNKSALSIEPAVMSVGPSGAEAVPAAAGQRADGLLIRRQVSRDGTPREYVARDFIPWSNVACVKFEL